MADDGVPAVRRVLFSSPFIPPEFIAAHGLHPVRITGQATVSCHAGRCAVAGGLEEAVAAQDGLGIIATSCDQMRRSGDDAARPVFRFQLPATWTSATAARIYRDELSRLSRFLARHGGSVPDRARLARHCADHDERRRRLRLGCAVLPSRAVLEILDDFHARGVVPAADPVPMASDSRVPLALIGGPLPRSAYGIHDLIESCGARVALDGTENGERGLAVPFDHRQLRDDPVAELVSAYFLSIPDAFRRPDSLLYAWLERGIAERGIRGLVLRCDPWCDLWRAQVPRLKDWGRLPVVQVDAGEEQGATPRLATRIEALVEMVARDVVRVRT